MITTNKIYTIPGFGQCIIVAVRSKRIMLKVLGQEIYLIETVDTMLALGA